MNPPAATALPPSADLLEIIPALVACLDADGCYRQMSRAYAEWYGIRREDYLNRHYSAPFSSPAHQEFLRHAAPHLEQAFRGQTTQFESRFRNPAGLRQIRLSYLPDRAPAGQLRGVLIHVTDITDLLAARQQSAVSEERLQMATEAGNLAVWELDLASQRLTWTTGCFQLMRYDEEETPSIERFLSRIHPEDKAARDAAFNAALPTCGSFRYDYRVLAGDNTWRWIHSRGRFLPDPEGKAARALGVIFDVTDIRNTEERAARQARHIDQILESTTDGVIMIDRAYRLTYFNARAAAMLRLRTDHLGAIAWDIFPHARENRFGANYTRAMEKRVQSSFEEYYPEPYNRWFEAHVYPTEDGVAGFFRDVTERRRAEESLRLQEQAIAAVPVGITISRLTEDGTDPIVYVNPAFERITGYSHAEVIGRNCEFLHGPETEPAARLALRDAVRRGEPAKLVVSNYRRSGESFANEVQISPVRNEEGRITHLVGIQNDVTERIAAARRLTCQAQYDALTQIPNRYLFLERLKQALRTAKRSHRREVALLYLDVDNLRHVNERLGHLGGDRLLRQIGRRIQSSIRSTDLAARIGGDEFGVLITHLEDRTDVEKLLQRLLRRISAPFRIAGREVITTVTAGYALAPADASDSEELLRKADLAMCTAKRHCRNSWKGWCPSMESRNKEILDIASGLRHALRENQLVLFYQPRIDAASGRLRSLEALIRWQHPLRGLIPPGEFIPVAEETGLIMDVGQWVLEEAVRQLADWRSQGRRPLPVSVNVSAAQFRNPGFAQGVREALSRADVDPSLLEIELTESIFMDETVSSDLLKSLHDVGVRIAIDDFGTGYSGLGYLSRFSVDTLKIDRAFTHSIGHNSTHGSICRSILRLAQELRLTTVAEGVETAEQADLLRDWGCDELQGFHFGRPAPAADIQCLMTGQDQPLFLQGTTAESDALTLSYS